VVANHVASVQGGLDVVVRLQGIARRVLALELDYLGCVPKDESVSRAVAMGQPYVLGAPRCKAARALETVVNKLIHRSGNPDVVC